MTNIEIVEAYANGKEFGQANSIFIGGKAIYSYGSHFPMALRKNGNEYLINTDKYSRTTSKHQSQLRQALSKAQATLINSTTQELRNLI